MNDQTPKDAETFDQRYLRMLEQKQKRDQERKRKHQERELARDELVARFEEELGPEGSSFGVYDTGHVDDPLIVVKRPARVQWTKFSQSKQTVADRYDLIAPSLVHPSIDEWNALLEKRAAVDLGVSNLLSDLMGLKQEADQGK